MPNEEECLCFNFSGLVRWRFKPISFISADILAKRQFSLNGVSVCTRVLFCDEWEQVLICTQFEMKQRRLFLKRAIVDTIDETQLFLGNQIMVFARQLKIQDYANTFTKEFFEKQVQTFVIDFFLFSVQM